MILSSQNVTLLLTTLTVGLVAGLFFAWTFSVTNGISRLSDSNYLSAMQEMNKAILNPVFLLVFLCSLLCCAVNLYVHFGILNRTKFYLVLSAAFLYFIGVFLVTIIGNIPLNNILEVFDISGASPAELKDQRLSFEGPWNRLNMIRTISSFATFALLLISCFMDDSN